MGSEYSIARPPHENWCLTPFSFRKYLILIICDSLIDAIYSIYHVRLKYTLLSTISSG